MCGLGGTFPPPSSSACTRPLTTSLPPTTTLPLTTSLPLTTPPTLNLLSPPKTHAARLTGVTRSSTGQDAGSAHWAAILGVLESALGTLRDHHVPAFLVRKLYEQLFSFINVQLFNQLLLRRECCSFSNGEYVKTGLAEVEIWAGSAGRTWVGEGWEALAHIRQAVTFLVIHQKHKKSLQEITTDLCPVLTVQQLYRISTMYWDDRWVRRGGRMDTVSGGGCQGEREGVMSRGPLVSTSTLQGLPPRSADARSRVSPPFLPQVWHRDREP